MAAPSAPATSVFDSRATLARFDATIAGVGQRLARQPDENAAVAEARAVWERLQADWADLVHERYAGPVPVDLTNAKDTADKSRAARARWNTNLWSLCTKPRHHLNRCEERLGGGHMPPSGMLGRAPRVPVGLRTGGGGGGGGSGGGCDAEAVCVTPLPPCSAGDAAEQQAEVRRDCAEEFDGGEEGDGEAWDDRSGVVALGSDTMSIPDVPGAEEARQLGVAVLKDQRDDAVKIWVRMPPVRFLMPRRHRTQRMYRLRKEAKAKSGDVALLDRRLWTQYGLPKKRWDDRPETYGGYLESGNRVLAFDSGRLCFDRKDHCAEGPQFHTMHVKRARKKR
eukprot:Rhum_TRINITY_DN11834_c0_g1::Rhum_TRINITY_DN11834_c0_g1_i1::g.47370::m.47370